jgi:hypothetical protein
MLLKNLANETSRKYAGVKVGNLILSSLYEVKYDLKGKFLHNQACVSCDNIFEVTMTFTG